MSKTTHLVVQYDHDSKSFTFDGDGSREWIRSLFSPESNTWSDEDQEFIGGDIGYLTDALFALEALGIKVDEPQGWLAR
jgi:hypothetical protein